MDQKIVAMGLSNKVAYRTVTSNKPLISIVIATFNVQKVVREAIRSILEQTFKDLEVIVIDGLSNDATLEEVTAFKSEKISVVSERDKGIYDAWNKGIRISKGEWLLFIGADDKLGPADSLERLVIECETRRLFNLHDVIYSDLVVLGRNCEPMDRIGAAWENPWSVKRRFIRSSFPIPIMATLFKKEALVKHGGFSLDFRIIADIELVLRIAKSSTPIYVPGFDVTIMGYGGISTDPRRALALLAESYRVRRKHSLGTLTNLGFILLSVKQITKFIIAKCLGGAISARLLSAYQNVKKRKLSPRNS